MRSLIPLYESIKGQVVQRLYKVSIIGQVPLHVRSIRTLPVALPNGLNKACDFPGGNASTTSSLRDSC